MAWWVKNTPAMQEMKVQSLGREDPLEGEMATHSSNYSCLENTMDRLWGTLEGDKKKSKGKGTGLSMKDSTDK